jgi:hypothetical protein
MNIGIAAEQQSGVIDYLGWAERSVARLVLLQDKHPSFAASF